MTSLHLTDEEVRNAALCLIAADSCMCDGMTPESAVEFARGIEHAMNTNPAWAGGRHQGDCTKTAHPCARCQIEAAEAEARKLYEA